MKKSLLAAILCGTVAAMALPTIAMEHDHSAPATQPTTQPTTEPTAGAPINKMCPVEGGEIDPAVTTVYKGQTIGFCCSMCIPTFNAEPEKYMEKLK